MADGKSAKWRPSPLQAAVFEAALESGVKRTITKICEEAQVHRSTFYDWLRDDPGFRDAWNRLFERAVERHFTTVVAAMVHVAQEGDVGAARLVAELRGVLKQRLEVTGKDGGPVQTLDLSEATPAQLDALMSLAPGVLEPHAAPAEPTAPATTAAPSGDAPA